MLIFVRFLLFTKKSLSSSQIRSFFFSCSHLSSLLLIFQHQTCSSHTGCKLVRLVHYGGPGKHYLPFKVRSSWSVYGMHVCSPRSCSFKSSLVIVDLGAIGVREEGECLRAKAFIVILPMSTMMVSFCIVHIRGEMSYSFANLCENQNHLFLVGHRDDAYLLATYLYSLFPLTGSCI